MKDKIEVAVIGTVGVPAMYGGFETLAQQLITNNENSTISYTVYCSAKNYPERLPEFRGARLRYLPFDANGMQSIIYDVVAIIDAVFSKNKVLLILGVSGCFILPLIRLFSRKKVIVHIDGLEWKRDKWNRFGKWFLKLSEKIAVMNSDFTIADNQAIKDYLVAEYGKNSELIEYGADHIVAAEHEHQRRDYAFSVCRIEPENNIHLILEAFSRFPARNLKFVGNWSKSSYGRDLYERYARVPNIELINPVYDQNKLDELRANCAVYIHGHSAGGTNPSLVEAMMLSLPVLAFDVPYNRHTTESKALFFKDAASLVSLLQTTGDQWEQVRREMREIAGRRYRWSIISEKYRNLFTSHSEKFISH